MCMAFAVFYYLCRSQNGVSIFSFRFPFSLFSKFVILRCSRPSDTTNISAHSYYFSYRPSSFLSHKQKLSPFKYVSRLIVNSYNSLSIYFLITYNSFSLSLILVCVCLCVCVCLYIYIYTYIVTCWLVYGTKMTGSSSDDWIY
jgi:hypothetical protein